MTVTRVHTSIELKSTPKTIDNTSHSIKYTTIKLHALSEAHPGQPMARWQPSPPPTPPAPALPRRSTGHIATVLRVRVFLPGCPTATPCPLPPPAFAIRVRGSASHPPHHYICLCPFCLTPSFFPCSPPNALLPDASRRRHVLWSNAVWRFLTLWRPCRDGCTRGGTSVWCTGGTSFWRPRGGRLWRPRRCHRRPLWCARRRDAGRGGWWPIWCPRRGGGSCNGGIVRGARRVGGCRRRGALWRGARSSGARRCGPRGGALWRPRTCSGWRRGAVWRSGGGNGGARRGWPLWRGGHDRRFWCARSGRGDRGGALWRHLGGRRACWGGAVWGGGGGRPCGRRPVWRRRRVVCARGGQWRVVWSRPRRQWRWHFGSARRRCHCWRQWHRCAGHSGRHLVHHV